MKQILIVGAGFSGAVIGRELAEAGFYVHIIDARTHIAGNCHTFVDSRTGITVHSYGPHIFHTDNSQVWDYITQFGRMNPYICRVKATTRGEVFSLPINLHTINQFYRETFSPTEARDHIASIASGPAEPLTFEDQALRFVGPDLYEAFFKGYPLKQWGLHPNKLPASVLKRLPVRYSYDDNYFSHEYQAIPDSGYTEIVEKIIAHPRIRLEVGRRYDTSLRRSYDHIFFSGPLDQWFDFKAGRLGYRTLRFEKSYHQGDFQGCAVMSYPEENVPFTRVTEHKHFAPWQAFGETIVFHEYSRQANQSDEPYYPIRLAGEQVILKDYLDLARAENGVTFVGRLGTYRYLDMDVTIAEALQTARQFQQMVAAGQPIPAFFHGGV